MPPTITIARYEVAPFDEPQYYVVGFRVQVSEFKEFYIEGIVPLPEAAGQTPQSITELAYAKIRDDLMGRVSALETAPPIIGQVFETDDMRTERARILAETEAATAAAAAPHEEERARITAEQTATVEEAARQAQEAEDAKNSGGVVGGRREEEANGEVERDGDVESDTNGGEPATPRRRRQRAESTES